MLKLGRSVPRVVDAEDQGLFAHRSEVADLGVVAVHDKRRVVIKPRNRLPPTSRDELELPVAIELVAKEVPETHGAGAQPLGHFR